MISGNGKLLLGKVSQQASTMFPFWFGYHITRTVERCLKTSSHVSTGSLLEELEDLRGDLAG
jgi:hypothetical protein